MVLYSLFAVPFFALFIVSYKLSEGVDARRLWVQYSRGLLTFIPAYIIFLLIGGLVPLTFSYGGIFAYYLFYNAVFYSVIAAGAFILIKRFSAEPDRGSVSEAFVFLAGFFTFASVLEIVRHFPYYDSFVLFLYPTMRLAVIAALAFFLARFFDARGWVKWAYLVSGLVFVVATALVPFFYVIHVGVGAIVAAVVLFALAIFPYVLMSL